MPLQTVEKKEKPGEIYASNSGTEDIILLSLATNFGDVYLQTGYRNSLQL
jgi:hypothetical protein